MSPCRATASATRFPIVPYPLITIFAGIGKLRSQRTAEGRKRLVWTRRPTGPQKVLLSPRGLRPHALLLLRQGPEGRVPILRRRGVLRSHEGRPVRERLGVPRGAERDAGRLRDRQQRDLVRLVLRPARVRDALSREAPGTFLPSPGLGHVHALQLLRQRSPGDLPVLR